MFHVCRYMGEVSILTRYLLYFSKTQLDYILTKINNGAQGIPDSFEKLKSGEIEYMIVMIAQPQERYYKITYEVDRV